MADNPPEKETLTEKKRKYVTRDEFEQEKEERKKWQEEQQQSKQTNQPTPSTSRQSEAIPRRVRTPVQIVEVPQQIREVPPNPPPSDTSPTEGRESVHNEQEVAEPRKNVFHRRFIPQRKHAESQKPSA